MKNLEYWKTSLANVLEKEEITDLLVEKLIAIYEMEYEYTEFESHNGGNDENPLQNKLDSKEKEIQIYRDFICKTKKADSVGVECGEVRLYNKLP